MANPSFPEPVRKSDWVLTQSAFQQLLDWLDGGSDSGGERYLEIRRRLVQYFDRKNCPSPEELADDTLNRVTRRLEEERTITGDAPAQYCYIVARYVLLESLRQRNREQSIKEELPAPRDASEEKREAEQRSEALQRCMQNLAFGERTLIVGYYQGEQRAKIENRRSMAAKLGITMNALTIRACRIREKLETCLRKLMERNHR
jgi:DNA-directed RNA polymerase specialized sigma24 family protein